MTSGASPGTSSNPGVDARIWLPRDAPPGTARRPSHAQGGEEGVAAGTRGGLFGVQQPLPAPCSRRLARNALEGLKRHLLQAVRRQRAPTALFPSTPLQSGLSRATVPKESAKHVFFSSLQKARPLDVKPNVGRFAGSHSPCGSELVSGGSRGPCARTAERALRARASAAPWLPAPKPGGCTLWHKKTQLLCIPAPRC